MKKKEEQKDKPHMHDKSGVRTHDPFGSREKRDAMHSVRSVAYLNLPP